MFLGLKIRVKPNRLRFDAPKLDRSETIKALAKLGDLFLKHLYSSVDTHLSTLEKRGRTPTGRLKRSFKVMFPRAGERSASVRIVSRGVPYAWIHETGGAIHAKSSPMPVPLYRTMSAYGWASARDYASRYRTFVRSGYVFFFPPGAKKAVPAFKLKEKVFVPRRAYLTHAVTSFHGDPRVERILENLAAKMKLEVREYKR